MAAHPQHRPQLSRLQLPSFHSQQPVQPLFSPGLPTAIQQGFHAPPPFMPMGGPQALQTPMQPGFFPPPPGAPGRPMGHRAQASLALAAAGIHPPMGVPMTPLGQAFPPGMMLGGGGGPSFPQPFVPKRRQPSVSIGGPPKAALGGAGKNYRPPSPTKVVAPAAPKPKKGAVNFPKETIPGKEGEPATRASWARTPLKPEEVPVHEEVKPLEATTGEIYPPDFWRREIPDTVDVFLPGKVAWDAIKQRAIEEKLEKLGVEKGAGSYSTVPHIHAPHARAASISSPADPALLFFKLNKLQQSQNVTQTQSASTSPRPPFSTSPNLIPPRFQNKHGHSLSLAAAQAPSFQPASFNPSAAFNPFGPGAVLGSDTIEHRSSQAQDITAMSDPGAPTDSSLAPPPLPIRADSRPDFVRGFGLDIPEEEEPPEVEGEDDMGLAEASHVAHVAADETIDMDIEMDVEGNIMGMGEDEGEQGSVTTTAQSRMHSRHVSKLSAALSLMSVGGQVQEPYRGGLHGRHETRGDAVVDELDREAVGEWTGSEDLRTGAETTEDEESIGEWSNPSDEERARHERLQRRILRKKQQEIQTPRRLPNFPHPPHTTPAYAFGQNAAQNNNEQGDDDLLSNPSDEGQPRNVHHEDMYRPMTSSSGTTANRPLPLVPASQPEPAQYSVHDPALAHSRHGSDNFHYPRAPLQMAMPQPVPQMPMPMAMPAAPTPPSAKRESLNPHAKPFVFGASRMSGSWAAGTFGPSQAPPMPAPQPAVVTTVSKPVHARAPSFGKPLNATAAEFKPGQFTFRMPMSTAAAAPAPVTIPQQPVPQMPSARPLPDPPTSPIPVRASQGREKRQRRASVASDESDDSEANREAMTSFKFPPDSPSVRRSAPPSPAQSTRRANGLNATARPFTLSTFSGNSLPFGAGEGVGMPEPQLYGQEVESPEDEDDDGEELRGSDRELPVPPTMKARRAPIPLDFKHPVSTNTVPAGLFKALANGEDERTRRTVRSRLSSREIFDHVSRPSLDDLNMPAISRSAAAASANARSRMVTDPGRQPHFKKDVFSPMVKIRRRSSLPALHSGSSSISGDSIGPTNISRRLEMQQYEDRLEALLDEKIEAIAMELREQRQTSEGHALSPSTEAMINEVVTLFRAQLQESAARGLEDSQMDARGELDFQVLRDVIEQGHAEARALMQQELTEILRRLEAQSRELPAANAFNVQSIMEDYHTRTVNSVVNAVSQIASRVDGLSVDRARTPHMAPQFDREGLLRELMNNLLPHLNAMRPEPIDYNGLTDQLTQAVKPHISQLIDLASDKRETAGLIVDRLVPVLPQIYPPAQNVDSSAIAAQVSNEVRKIIAPIDAHEIKEQVSDLVVERLDSRLAVRDRALDSLSGKLNEGMGQLMDPMREVVAAVNALQQSQESLATHTRDISSIRRDVVGLLSDLPTRLTTATEALNTIQEDLRSRPAGTAASDPATFEHLRHVQAAVDGIVHGQKALESRTQEILGFHQELLTRLTVLPEGMAATTKAVQSAHADVLARAASKQDIEEVRRVMTANADLQVQLAKARAAHGSVRVEKDVVAERASAAEMERDRLRAQVDELQSGMITRATEAATSEARNAELEEALSQALARLKTSDVAAQTQQDRIAELEKANKELGTEKQALRAQVHTLEMQAGFAMRDKDAAIEALTALQRDHDNLLSQQGHWDDLRRTTEQLDMLTAMMTQNNEPELKELRRVRDKSKILEGEYAALQRRFKDQEHKATSSDRAAAAARNNLTQAQQRAAEWEKRAKEYEAELEGMRTSYDHADEKVAQLETDYSLAKLQLEEKEADERLTKDRESKLRDQVAGLEARVARLQAESDQAKKAAASSSPPRPDSRASTVYPSRAATPVQNGRRSNTPPQTSVWDSMHAPKRYPALGNGTPKIRPGGYYRGRVASPTPSVISVTPSAVSVTPTQGADGWWS
ncbi:hypothetical protein DENSPDRAFT_783512 [Dentipellis sp. KUC8613]|nr:hypothetical protein DENSPDRAFT_783512 [Dentipellis sp. KUC8613]